MLLIAGLILNTQQVTLTADNPEPCISFTAVDDGLGLEGQEMLTLSLSGPPTVLFQTAVFTFFVNSVDGMFNNQEISFLQVYKHIGTDLVDSL